MPQEALFYKTRPDKTVHCSLCRHHCKIKPGKYGICGMRHNPDGHLVTHAYGEVIAANADPIEKKPLYHVLPGSTSFSIATMGCNFQCGFCQNWQISQSNIQKGGRRKGYRLSPQQIVDQARQHHCRSISYTYTEPTIYFEYALATARLAHAQGMLNVFVTNGFMETEPLKTIQPYLDACNVDLKAFSDQFYRRQCRGRLQPVLDNIRLMRDLDIWVEVTTLVIPGQNDAEEQLERIAGFLADVDPQIPWHLSRFHPDYQLTDAPHTPIETLTKAATIGRQAGLQFIYLGNVMEPSTDTACPSCGAKIIERGGYRLGALRIVNGKCDHCKATIAGIFD